MGASVRCEPWGSPPVERDARFENGDSMKTLKAFYELMEHTAGVRATMVERYLDRGGVKAPQNEAIEALEAALATLESIPLGQAGRPQLLLDETRTVELDLGYEIDELKKDLLFFKEGEAAFTAYLGTLHEGFEAHIQRGLEWLGNRRFNNLVTDRDGTINNYCGRYRSSIQSAYNAIYLARFIRSHTNHAVVITSAPLQNPGILDVSVMPKGTFIYAASKAREFVDAQGTRQTVPVDAAQQAKLDELNKQLIELTSLPAYQKFALIGSGLQFKFGQTTIARQDITGTISAEESDAFMSLLRDRLRRIDPDGNDFAVEDTGLDVEIILTVSDDAGGKAGKDFDKADGLFFMDDKLDLGLSTGPSLVCGDTASDLKLVEACQERTDDVWSIFVARDQALADKVNALCHNALILPETDMLVALLDRLSLKGDSHAR